MSIGLACLSAACAPAPPRRVAPPRSPPSPATVIDAGAGVGSGAEEVPSLDMLAARGPADMPLMREALRVSEVATKPIDLEVKVDACFRAVVAASHPVRAWFEDDKHALRGERASLAGLVPPRGPACARKGEKLRLVVDAAPGTTARAVVWAAP